MNEQEMKAQGFEHHPDQERMNDAGETFFNMLALTATVFSLTEGEVAAVMGTICGQIIERSSDPDQMRKLLLLNLEEGVKAVRDSKEIKQ